MPDVAKRASLEATARSQLATSWQPAAVAMPWTCAITGCGISRSVAISRRQRAKSVRVVAGLGVRAHLLEIVSRAEGAARAGDHHDAHARVGGDGVERRLQRVDHLLGERVRLVGTVETQRREAVPILAKHDAVRIVALARHGGLPGSAGRQSRTLRREAHGPAARARFSFSSSSTAGRSSTWPPSSISVEARPESTAMV